jgi:glycerol-1-phosphate dehydrogenase [NAD(P)+]
MSPDQRAGLLAKALEAASDTKVLHMRRGALADLTQVFRSQFANASAIIIADPTTFEVAGKRTVDTLRAGGIDVMQPVLLTDADLHAEWKYVEQLDRALAHTEATPVSVGSGTINDLTKLAAHRAGRMYMAVPTAASMDGYTAFGASITRQGSKQTFSCPAPRAVVADLDVICTAPPEMTASGYADLMAKATAGADWILADALGVEPLDAFSWQLVQEPLHEWLADPSAIRAADPDAIGRLLEGLMMGGFAMQHHKTSRPASGAEHQFSHLWDMQHHTHDGHAPSHGFKVGIGTLAVARLYEALYEVNLETLDVAGTVAAFPSVEALEADIHTRLGTGDLAYKAVEETRAKYPSTAELEQQLTRLKSVWPELRNRLREHLPSSHDIAQRLAAAGAPTRPEEIGISTERLAESYFQALYIRRRFTVLDVAHRCGVLDSAVSKACAS